MSREYSTVRDEYLAHVEVCVPCNRNHWGHLGPRLQHWTLWQLCRTARQLLAEIEGMI